jgi:hypothetical protein
LLRDISITVIYQFGFYAQIDATEEDNKALATKFGVQGFPTLKVS